MTRFRIITLILLAVTCLGFPSKSGYAQDKIKIVTTTTVLADIAQEISGDKAEIFYVASPKRDLHKEAPTPKDVLKTKKADVFIYSGLQAEPWLLPLLNAAGRSDFVKKGGRSIDTSFNVTPLEVPEEVNRLEGDVHPHGNPHYWLDPSYGKLIADNIASSLSRLYPDQSDVFQERNKTYQKRLDEKIGQWAGRMSPFKNYAIVTYHRSWSYFAKAYGLKVMGEIEPKPGIPVTSKHLSKLRSLMTSEKVQLIFTEPYQNDKPSEALAEQTGAQVVELLQFNGAKKNVKSYIDLMDYNIGQIEKTLSEVSDG